MEFLFKGIDPTEFDAPANGKWNIRRRPDLPPQEPSRTDLQALVLNSLSHDPSESLESPESPPTDLSDIMSALIHSNEENLPEQVTIRTTELQKLFDQIDPSTGSPQTKWDFSNAPESVTVKTTQLQELLEHVEPEALRQKPDQFWKGVTLRTGPVI